MHPSPKLAWRIQVLAAAGLLVVCLLGTAYLLTTLVQRGPAAPVPTQEPVISVRLQRSATELALEGPTRFWITTEDASPREFETPSRIRRTDDAWVLLDERNARTSLGAASAPLRIYSTVGTLSISGRGELAGAIRLHRRSDAPTMFDVMGVLSLERYVAGVISAETYAGWGLEALKAQGVAARSYAISERNRARAAHRTYDINAGHSAQAFALEPRDDAVAAADATRGVVLTWEGSVLRAYYSSTCGGRCASARDNWSGPENEAAPLDATVRPTYCQASPLFRWSVERTTATLSARLAAWGRDRNHAIAKLGVIARIDAETVNTAGRPTRFVVVDRNGDRFTLAAESLRLACNHALAGRRPERRVRSNDLQFEVRGGTTTINGRGFGHGVGLCQFGASSLDDNGELWPAMLTIFYPGASLARAYE